MRSTDIRTALAALAVAVGLSSLPAEADTSAARGKAIAERQCSRCHATGRTGGSPLALAPPFRDLQKRYPVDALAEALAEGIVTGHPAMPAFTFKPAEVRALIAYFRNVGRP